VLTSPWVQQVRCGTLILQ